MRKEMKSEIKDILGPIVGYLDKVDIEIEKRLQTGISVLDVGSHHLFNRGGKKIRASMVILVSGLKSDISDSIVDIAAAAEIVHAATLIHDDIIDRASFRRGDETVSRKLGSKVAVLVGDYMYTTALDIIVEDPRTDLFPIIVSAARDMVKGELYQYEYSNSKKITREHYFNIIELKTARFMAACAKMGAAKSDQSDEECELMYKYGLNIGYAFQIIDDTLDFLFTVDTGKDAGNDFFDGKVTLPFLHLLETSDADERTILLEYAAEPTAEGWKVVKDKITSNGSIDYCIKMAKDYVQTASSLLDSYPESICKSILLDLSNFLLERVY